MNAAGKRNNTSSAAPMIACQLNRISTPPAISIAPLTGTPTAAAGTPLDCAYPVMPLAFLKWFTPDMMKKKANPMRPTQVRMVQRTTAALLWEDGVNDRGRSRPHVGAEHTAPLLVTLALLAACSSGPGPEHPVPVAAVAVSPKSLVVRVGQTAQLTALPLDAHGTPLAGRAVTWATTNSSVATVTAGSVAAPGASAPDPTLLPEATPSQAPLTALYDLLHVPALAAGGSYLDPTTGVTVYRLTSATFTTTSTNWGHDYAEGGDEISLAYHDSTRAVLVHGDGGYWLVDFTPGAGMSNGRPLTGGFAPVHDQAFAFSTNPATPWYAYVSNGSALRRLDIRTMTESAGDGWPVANEPEAVWLQQSENDGLFVWMRGQSGPTVVGYEP